MVYRTNPISSASKGSDEGFDMIINSPRLMVDSPDMQEWLLKKVDNYLKYINGGSFTNDFPGINRKNVRIIYNVQEKSPDFLLKLYEKISAWTSDNGVEFVVRENNN